MIYVSTPERHTYVTVTYRARSLVNVNVESMDGQEKEKIYYGSLWSSGAEECVDVESAPRVLW